MPENKKEKQEPLVYSPPVLLDTMDQEESGGIPQYDKILPAFDRNNVAVCIVSSDEYAPFASVVIQSLIYNSTPDNNYDVVLLSDDMLMRNRWRIESQADGHDNVSIRIIDISEIVKEFNFYTWAHFTSKTYYRLLTPDLFSAYDKIIYLDSDIVVNQDIAELYKTDLEGYLLAAAYDTHVVSYCTQDPPLEQRDYNIKTLKMEEPEQYFQAGVSLFNVKAYHENYESGYLITQGAEHQLRWLDQDLLNMLFYGKIKRLPNKWNVMVANVMPYVDEYYLKSDLRKEYYEARRNPGIIHYVGRAIPCYTDKPDLYEYYWQYARQTPFYEVLLQRMTMDYSEKTIAVFRQERDAVAESLRADIRRLSAELEQIKGGQIEPVHTEKFHQKVKRKIMPLFDFFCPKESKRRILIKKCYFRLRGWQV
jgi:lipopolysaccharide biosynthesis glycosyltransferase